MNRSSSGTGRLPGRWPTVLLAVAGLVAAGGLLADRLAGPGSDGDDGWVVVHDGYGEAGTQVDERGRQVRDLRPQRSGPDPAETHAGLVRSTDRYRDLELDLEVRTVEQLRTAGPNPWEVAWVVWHYGDDQHFYYVALKPNGWELGKRDPAYPGGQRFLATGDEPRLALGTWHGVRVRHVGDEITVWVDDTPVTTYRDDERPYRSGSVALYTEDAHAQFADITVTDPAATPTASS